MAKDSPRAEELDAILSREAVAIAKAIVLAPPWQPKWPVQAASKFYDLLNQDVEPLQDTLPGFTTDGADCYE
jgi:hypothetical protein